MSVRPLKFAGYCYRLPDGQFIYGKGVVTQIKWFKQTHMENGNGFGVF